MEASIPYPVSVETSVENVSNPGTVVAEPVPPARGFDQTQPAQTSKWYRWRKSCKPIIDYLLDAEVHTYAFSVAANAIISFIPLVILLYTLAISVFHSREMVSVVNKIVEQFLPTTAVQRTQAGSEDFLAYWLRTVAAMSAGRGVQAMSVVMILISCTGIFLPLEVALNKVWGIPTNRSYLRNQLLSLGLALGCGMLAMGSVALTAGNLKMLGVVVGYQNFVARGTAFIVMKSIAILATMLIFFLIYWILPNAKIPWRAVLPAAIITGAFTEAAKYIYILLLPWLDFQGVYGPFAISVTLMIWAYVSGMLLLGGAHLSATDPRLVRH